MSLMDDIVARSRAPGDFISRGSFSLSKDKAMEKIREFSLRHPEQYVLELIQAANFSGASYIAVNVDTQQLILAWVGGPPITEGELSQIFDYLFIRSSRSQTRHLHQLAIGLNALLQRRPEVLRIESGDGTREGTARLDLSADGEGRVGVPTEPLAGTYILARFSHGWLKRFADSFSKGAASSEALLIESNCLYTPVPILLNGRAPFGWKASRRIVYGPGAASFSEGGRRGSLQVPSQKSEGRRGIDLVVGGVRITTQPIPELGHHEPHWSSLMGVICDDDLRKTADQSGIVQDSAWGSMLGALQPFATRMIRKEIGSKGSRYRAPKLPQFSEPAPNSDDKVTLPDPIKQLEPRPALGLDSAQKLILSGPAFYCQPGDAEGLRSVADPERFPFPVFILSDPQADAVSALSGDGALHRISTDADVAFIRRAIERDQEQASVEVPFSGHASGASGVLTLRLTIQGPRAAWGDPQRGALPLTVGYGGEALWCDHLRIRLPGMQASLALESPQTLAHLRLDQVAIDVSTAIHAYAWLLTSALDTSARKSSARAFIMALLSHHVQPQVYRAGGALQLGILLPPAWGPGAHTFLETSLLDSPGEILTIEKLAAMQGSAAVLDIESLESLLTIEVLESRFGYGHLRHPAHKVPVIIFAGLRTRTSQALKSSRSSPRVLTKGCLSLLARPEVAIAFWLSAERRPTRPEGLPEGLKMHELALPHLGVACPGHGPAPEVMSTYLSDVRAALIQRLEQGHWPALGPAISAGRARSAARMAILGLSAHLKDNGDHPLTNPSTLDELLLLEAATGRQHELGIDDPPELWRTLQDPESEDWIARQPVNLPGLSGWLGLRLPYDASGGLLLQSLNHLWSTEEPDNSLPCHGLITFAGPCDSLSERERHLIQHAQHQLYRTLLDRLKPTPESPADIAVHRYLIHYIGPRLQHSSARQSAHAARLAGLATELIIYDGEAPWGTLSRWRHTQEGSRPTLPFLRSSAEAPAAPDSLEGPVERREVLSALRNQVAASLGMEAAEPQERGSPVMPQIIVRSPRWYQRRQPVRIIDDPAWTPQRSGEREPPGARVLALDPEDALVIAAVDRGDPVSLDVLILECCRILALASFEDDAPLDLHTAHQYLASQRL
jgi:hypothetical protein